jgi:hypothetical protein
METLRCCEVYHPETDRWTSSAPLQIARSGSRVVSLGVRCLVAIGGCDDVFGRAETQPTVELFDSALGYWTLLETRLEHPRTTAAVAAIDDRRLLVVGGAPSLSSAEVYTVTLPPDGRRAEEEAAGANAEPRRQVAPLKVVDMPEGRMGCQAAVVSLPGLGCTYPMALRSCVVIVGGERCDEGGGAAGAAGGDWPRVRQFSSVPVFDIASGLWRSEEVVPEMATARTAVALCVGHGCVVSSAVAEATATAVGETSEETP